MAKIKGKKSMGIDEVKQERRNRGSEETIPPPDFGRYIKLKYLNQGGLFITTCSPPPLIFRTSCDPGEERKEIKQGETFFATRAYSDHRTTKGIKRTKHCGSIGIGNSK